MFVCQNKMLIHIIYLYAVTVLYTSREHGRSDNPVYDPCNLFCLYVLRITLLSMLLYFQYTYVYIFKRIDTSEICVFLWL